MLLSVYLLLDIRNLFMLADNSDALRAEIQLVLSECQLISDPSTESLRSISKYTIEKIHMSYKNVLDMRMYITIVK